MSNPINNIMEEDPKKFSLSHTHHHSNQSVINVLLQCHVLFSNFTPIPPLYL